VTAERKVSKVFGGSCQVPLAAYATVVDGQMHLRAMVATPDGARMASAEVRGAAASAEQLGQDVAELLRGQDAVAILASCLADAATADAAAAKPQAAPSGAGRNDPQPGSPEDVAHRQPGEPTGGRSGV
jgi:hydroxymethylbilane synthase